MCRMADRGADAPRRPRPAIVAGADLQQLGSLVSRIRVMMNPEHPEGEGGTGRGDDGTTGRRGDGGTGKIKDRLAFTGSFGRPVAPLALVPRCPRRPVPSSSL